VACLPAYEWFRRLTLRSAAEFSQRENCHHGRQRHNPASFALLKSNVPPTAIVFAAVEAGRAAAQIAASLQSGQIRLPAARR